jgi:hypothetical protein
MYMIAACDAGLAQKQQREARGAGGRCKARSEQGIKQLSRINMIIMRIAERHRRLVTWLRRTGGRFRQRVPGQVASRDAPNEPSQVQISAGRCQHRLQSLLVANNEAMPPAQRCSHPGAHDLTRVCCRMLLVVAIVHSLFQMTSHDILVPKLADSCIGKPVLPSAARSRARHALFTRSVPEHATIRS